MDKIEAQKSIYYDDERKNEMKITYRQVGDYQIPNLTLPPKEANICLDKWGMLHRDYLKNHDPVLFATLISQGRLWQHFAQIDKQAEEMFNTLIYQMAKSENITEKHKEQNQMEWAQRMNNIYQRATEIVNRELIYT